MKHVPRIVCLTEYRTQRDADERDEAEVADREALKPQVIAYCKGLLSDQFEHLKRAGAGCCDDCIEGENDVEHRTRFHFGRFVVCRNHARTRDLARALSQAEAA